jgi:DNA (cytosine-5)-methyltransferase 1
VGISSDGKVQTLTSRMGTGGGNVPLLMDPISVDARHADDVVRISEKVPTLEARDYKGGAIRPYTKDPADAVGMRGRRQGTIDSE